MSELELKWEVRQLPTTPFFGIYNNEKDDWMFHSPEERRSVLAFTNEQAANEQREMFIITDEFIESEVQGDNSIKNLKGIFDCEFSEGEEL